MNPVPNDAFGIPVAAVDAAPARLARAWLTLGVGALIGSGLLAVLLVLARTPGIGRMMPSGDFFRAALIVHVDLSVLIWFMAFAAVIWSLAGTARFAALGWASVVLAAAGTLLMTVSPFGADAKPYLNNYIPVLEQPLFFAGLVTAGSGFALAIVRALLVIPPAWRANSSGGGTADAGALRVGAWLAAVAGACAFTGFAASWLGVPDAEGQARWEMVFWGGGHALQFQHALLAVVAWFWLAGAMGARIAAGPRAQVALFALAALPLAFVPLIYVYWDVGSAFHMANFARLMEVGHPLMLPLVVFALGATWQARHVAGPVRSALMASLLLFGVGGGLAYLIKGVNVVIPAHYHGSIVGITLAFMGLAYVLLPQLGYGNADGRMARWQPWVYGGGQLIHILGLAWSGGYGVQRKVAGAEQVLTTLPQKIGMGMMGAGGLIAIIGGVMFVLVCLKAMLGRRAAQGAVSPPL